MMQKNGKRLINDFRVPTEEEFEYAQSFSTPSPKKTEVNKSKSGNPDKLSIYNLFGNVDEWTSPLNNPIASSGPVGFRIVSTFLGKLHD